MTYTEAIPLPRVIVRRLRQEAVKRGISVEEYLLDLLSKDLNPEERAQEYIEAASELLEQAKEELKKSNIRQAAEKLWGVVALAVKAYAYWRENRRLTSHGELWKYILVLQKEIGKWVSDSWNAGNSMHTCFYEGWCRKEHVEDAIEKIERLVKEVASRIKGSKHWSGRK